MLPASLRAGTITDENISMTIMGDYTAFLQDRVAPTTLSEKIADSFKEEEKPAKRVRIALMLEFNRLFPSAGFVWTKESTKQALLGSPEARRNVWSAFFAGVAIGGLWVIFAAAEIIAPHP